MEKQTFANEMTCHFNLREPKSQRPTNIYCIVCIDGKQMKFPTGVKIYPEQWNKKKQYLQPIITQYFIDNKSEIWLLFLIAHSKR